MRYIGPITLIVAILALFAATATAEPPATPAKSSVCPSAEDSPKWNWAKCGNGKRGIITRGPYVFWKAVSVCEFQHYVRNDWIDWKRSGHMRGDRLAKRTRCGSQ